MSVVIAFGGIAHMLYLPPFEFFRITNSLSYSKILVRDFNQGWYHLGVNKGLNSFEAVLQRLRKIIENLTPKTITVIGSSAGGYAALAFGHYLEVNAVHALAPQTFIDRKNRMKIGEERWVREIDRIYEYVPNSSWFFDLKNLLEAYNGRTNYTIHICKGHPLDLAYAKHIKGLPGVEVKLYPCEDHNVARYLKGNDKLACLLKKRSLVKNSPFNPLKTEHKEPSLQRGIL